MKVYARENYKAVDIPGNLTTFVTLFCVKVWSLRCSFFKKILLMYSSCTFYFGWHKSKYFYYQITFYMWYICCHKNKYHGGWTAEIKRKFTKWRLKIKGKLSFLLPRFYFVIMSLKDLAIFRNNLLRLMNYWVN